MKKIIILMAIILVSGCVATGINDGEFLTAVVPMDIKAFSGQRALKNAPTRNDAVLSKSPLPLDEVINYAVKNNPGLRAVREKWTAAKEGPVQARTLPDPMLQVVPTGDLVNTRNGEIQSKAMLSQKFPWFGKLSLKGEIAEKEAEVAGENYATIRLKLMANVKKAYYELYWITKAIRINEETKAILKNFENVANIKYAAGQVSQQDVLKAQVELSRIANDLITLEELKETARARLNILLNRLPEAKLGETADFEVSEFKPKLERLYQKAIDYQPILKSVRAKIEKSKLAYALSRKQFYPDLQLLSEYSLIDGNAVGADAGQDAWGIGLGVNLPIWRKKYRAGAREAEAKLRASQADYKNAENSVLFKVKDVHFKLDTAARLVSLYQTSILPQAEQSLKVSEAGYQSGEVDFLNLLDSERMLLNFRLAYYRALADHQQRLADLEEIVGGELE